MEEGSILSQSEGFVLAIEVKQSGEKLSGKRLSEFMTKPNMEKSEVVTEAYQLCVKADALRLANLHQDAISRYLNSILIDRDNADSYYGLGVCYKHLSNFDKAISALEKAKKIREMDYNIYYELGICYLLKGETCLSMKNLIKSLKLNPSNLDAQIQLAIAHEIVEENEIALMIYQKIIETSPSFIKAYNHKSALLMNMGDYFEASIVFNKILKLNPDYYRAYLGIGICFDKMDKSADAMRYYKKFIDRKPNSHHASFVKSRIIKLKSEKKDSGFLSLV